jgi:hypothetical protein
MGTTSLFASIGNNAATEKFELENQNVKLTFSINSESEIVVLSVNSKKSDILKFVRNNLNGKKIKGKGLRPGKGNKVTITFSVNSTSNIVVLAVDSNNTDILNYVRQNLNGKKI